MANASVEIVTTRANHLVDPALHIWGWEIPVYLFLGGLVAGLMVLTVALELKTGQRPRGRYTAWLPFAALGLLSVGMGALFLDLENKLNVWRFYTAFQPRSPMSWGSWVLVAVYPAVLLQGLGGLDEAQRAQVKGLPGLRAKRVAGLVDRLFALADLHRPLVLWGVLLLGVGLGTYTGVLLGTSSARALWNTALLGPLFMASGLSTGAAAMLLSGLEEREQHLVLRWDMVAIAVELGLLMLLLLGLATGPTAAQNAGAYLMGGTWTPWFWSLVVVAGLLVPLLLDGVELRRRLPMTLAAPALVLLGGFALRVVLVYAGQLPA